MRTCSVLEIALLVGAMGSPVAAVEILVRPDGTGDYRHIAAAAGQALDGDVIVLTDGVFSGYGNRQASLLNKSVTLRSQSGNPADCIIEVENNGYWFLGGSVAEGITFRGGRIGLRLEENASVRNCVFEESTFGSIYARENTGTIEDTIVRNGGMHAILCEEGNMLITGCTVESNSNPTTNYQAPVGVNGGVATIENCRIVGNRGSKLAGGVSATNWSNVTLRGCTITGNTSPLHAGGVWSGTHSTMTIENCTIANNRGPVTGGVYGEYGVLTVERSIVWTDCEWPVWVGTSGTITFDCGVLAPPPISARTGGNEPWPGTLILGPDVLRQPPGFCGAADCAAAPTPEGDYTLQEDSPVFDLTCGAVGALPVGCTVISVEATSWARLKSMHR